jgi:hypothetical protein
MTLTTEQVAWIQNVLGMDISSAAGAAGLADAGQPALAGVFDSLQVSIQGLLVSPGEGLQFDVKPDGGAPPPDPKKLEADAKKVLAAMQDWKDRVAKITMTYEMTKLAEAHDKAVKDFLAKLKDGVAKNDLADAIKAMAGVEKALKALEATAKDLPKKQKAATDASDKIDKMSEADVAKLKPEDKAKLVKTMLAAGKPTGKVRDAQKKIYNTDLDPDFRKDDEARQDKMVADLKGDKELAEARGKWSELYKDKEALRKALGRVVAAQSKEYGISPPAIVFFPDEEPAVTKANGVVLGFFNPADGKLHVNLDPKAGITDFTTSIHIVLHENMHHYQQELVKLLAAGKLKSSDPRYKQALMFEVNSLEPGGYIDPDESSDKAKGVADYQNQPLERGAEFSGGPKTAEKVRDAVKPVKPPAKAP